MSKSSQNSSRFVEQISKIPHRITRVPITNLNPYLTCALCSGYLIDATTIVECLHSFCRACLLRYLETSDICPICDFQINRSQLHKSIRYDRTLQDLVYKLIPSLYKNELQKRKEFCMEHFKNESSDASTSSKSAMSSSKLFQIFDKNLVDLATSVCAPDEIVSFSLEFFIKNNETVKKPSVIKTSDDAKPSPNFKGLNNFKRYFRCPAAVKVCHLKKLLAHKLDLSASHQIEIYHRGEDYFGDELMKDDWSLMDIAFLYSWRRKSPMQLHFNVCKYEVVEEPMPELMREPEQQTPPISSVANTGERSSSANGNQSPEYVPYIDNEAKSSVNGTESQGATSVGSQEFKIAPVIYRPPGMEMSPSPCQLSPSSMSLERTFVQPAKLRLKKSLSHVVQQLNYSNVVSNNNNDAKIIPIDQHNFLYSNSGLSRPVNGTRSNSSSEIKYSTTPTTMMHFDVGTSPPANKKFKKEKIVHTKVETGNLRDSTLFNGSSVPGIYSSAINTNVTLVGYSSVNNINATLGDYSNVNNTNVILGGHSSANSTNVALGGYSNANNTTATLGGYSSANNNNTTLSGYSSVNTNINGMPLSANNAVDLSPSNKKTSSTNLERLLCT